MIRLHVTMPDYPPYHTSYGKLPKLFEKIQEAAVPSKFTQDFLETMLGFKSTSDRAFIGLLKRLGFLDQANIPTQTYKDYRDRRLAPQIMAERLRASYSQLFDANAYANKLSKDEITSTLKRLLGVGDNDQIVPIVASTFASLVSLANFEASIVPIKPESKAEEGKEPVAVAPAMRFGGLSYTIVLNLPNTTDIDVFNAIFKSLRENILVEKE